MNTNSFTMRKRWLGLAMAASHAFDAHVLQDYGRSRTIIGVARELGDFVRDVLAFHHFAENGVALIEPGRGRDRNKKLAAGWVWPGIGHGEPSRRRVAQGGMEFIREFISRAAGAGSQGASTLNHEIGNHAMKCEAVVKCAFCLLIAFRVGKLLCALGQPDEICDGLRRFLVKQTAYDVSLRRFENSISSRCSCQSGLPNNCSVNRCDLSSHLILVQTGVE